MGRFRSWTCGRHSRNRTWPGYCAPTTAECPWTSTAPPKARGVTRRRSADTAESGSTPPCRLCRQPQLTTTSSVTSTLSPTFPTLTHFPLLHLRSPPSSTISILTHFPHVHPFSPPIQNIRQSYRNLNVEKNFQLSVFS